MKSTTKCPCELLRLRFYVAIFEGITHISPYRCREMMLGTHDPYEEFMRNIRTSANSIDVLQSTHNFMRNKVAIIPHNEMWLPQKLGQRFPPFLSSTYSSIGIFLIIDLWSNVRTTEIQNILNWNSSCQAHINSSLEQIEPTSAKLLQVAGNCIVCERQKQRKMNQKGEDKSILNKINHFWNLASNPTHIMKLYYKFQPIYTQLLFKEQLYMNGKVIIYH